MLSNEGFQLHDHLSSEHDDARHTKLTSNVFRGFIVGSNIESITLNQFPTVKV